MRLYFAFGANLDIVGMSRRCPGAEPVGAARLDNHRFAIVQPGFATVIEAPGATVHGVLWRLSSRDINVLDAYENISSGLYGRAEKPVRHGMRTLRALTYFVWEPKAGRPKPGYLEDCVLPAARRWQLPQDYIRALEALVVSPGARTPWSETKPV
ncbi:MAG: gamma-glutamylcyclotransferase [Hyphomicrobiales bacterium]|nr:gamma-glutamylcyclotransferase [Hyphomicrobiales bacterium]